MVNDIQVSDLATFMGHTEKIHKDHYRQPLASRDILNISQYLDTVQGTAHDSNDKSSTDSSSENDELKEKKIFDDTNKENICAGKYIYVSIF